MTETPENRLKRLSMRSMRRGIKEMDLILTRFADDRAFYFKAQLKDIPQIRFERGDRRRIG